MMMVMVSSIWQVAGETCSPWNPLNVLHTNNETRLTSKVQSPQESWHVGRSVFICGSEETGV